MPQRISNKAGEVKVAFGWCLAASLFLYAGNATRGDSAAGLKKMPSALLICGNENLTEAALNNYLAANALPPATRVWENVPGVIRNDGIDTFRLEVNVNGRASRVDLILWPAVLSQSGQTNISLRDDGLLGDRAPNDLIYTSELLRFNTNQPWLHAPYYAYDTNSPEGLSIKDVGQITITETNGQHSGFSHNPQIAILSSNIPLVDVMTLSSDMVVSPHLINVRGSNLSVQKFIRGFALGTADLTGTIYSSLPDRFDFFIHFSTYRIERLPSNAGQNLTIGVHRPVQVNFTGTGQATFNNSAAYGSAGRLLGIVGLDCYERGLWSYNCTHEILHQWSSYIGALPVSDGQHYVSRSSAASLLGGHIWQPNGNSSWSLICEQGRNGATHLDLLDKYMMGLIPAAKVPVLRTYPRTSPLPLFMCNETITEVESVLTIENIIARYGLRSPGPETAKRDFAVAFVAESHGRLLNRVEMTFYDTLAGHYTKPVPSGHPDPYVGFNWVPITRFFGEGTTWRSDVLDVLRPQIVSAEILQNTDLRIRASGVPGRAYALQSSTDFSNWVTVRTQLAGADGTYVFMDERGNRSAKYYRVRAE